MTDRTRASRGALGTLGAGLCLTLLLAAPLSAQGGFTLVGGVAYEPGGPGPALVDGMRAAGFDDIRPGVCYGTNCPYAVETPFYYNAGIDLAAFGGFRYRAPGPFSVETLISNGQRGHAEGYDSGGRGHLLVSYASFILSTTVALHVGPIRLEAGPAVNRTGWAATRNHSRTIEGKTVTLGGTAAVSGEVRVGELLLSFKSGLRQFPAVDLRDPVWLALDVDYYSVLVGVTVTGWTD